MGRRMSITESDHWTLALLGEVLAQGALTLWTTAVYWVISRCYRREIRDGWAAGATRIHILIIVALGASVGAIGWGTLAPGTDHLGHSLLRYGGALGLGWGLMILGLRRRTPGNGADKA